MHVKAGETVTVTIYPSLADFTRTTLDGERVAHPGEYRVWFGVKETAAHGQGFAETTVTAV